MELTATNRPVSFIESIQASKIKIVCRDECAEQQAKAFGAKRSMLSCTVWTLNYKDDVELALYLSGLRDALVAMAGALGGWPPAEVFEQLRNKGLISGKFIEIMWSGRGEEVLTIK